MSSDPGIEETRPNTTAAEPPAGEGTSQAGRADTAIGAMLDSTRQPLYGQGIVVSLIAAAFLLVLAILAVREQETATGIPATETTGPLYWGLAVLFIAIIGAGAQYSEFSAAKAAEALGHTRRKRDLPMAWVVPAVGMAAAILLVATLHNTLMFVVGPAIAFFAVGGSLLARDLLDDATEATARTASIVHMIVIHVVAFLALSAVYLNRMTLWVSVPLVALFSGLLILETLERGHAPLRRRVLYAVIGAYVMAQAMIVVDWWLTYGWTGGGVLLVCFYIIAGILLVQTQRDEVRPRDLAEFGVVGAIALVILIITR